MDEELLVRKLPVVEGLNQVEGFDPSKLLRIINLDTEEPAIYLDVWARKLWFRLKNPAGKIMKKLLQVNADFALVEARVYLDKNDPEDCYVANAFGQRFNQPGDKYGAKYIELAETAAIGRALSDAGYGVQYSNNRIEGDMSPVDRLGNSAIMQSDIPLPAESVTVNNEVTAMTEPEPAIQPKYTVDMAVEEIIAYMSLAEAKSVPVNFKGMEHMTLGRVAVEKPATLLWITESYKGPDNILRAGAQLLRAEATKAP